MKPLAKLVIHKLREYKKSCEDSDSEPGEGYLDFADFASSHSGQWYNLTETSHFKLTTRVRIASIRQT